MRISTVAVLAATLSSAAVAANAWAASTDYRFELAGAPQSDGDGTSVVSVKLVHLPDNRPVTGATVFQTRVDMGPGGMGDMTAPIATLPEKPAGTYRFQIHNGPVWKKPDNWALTLDARVRGEAEPVHGSLVVKLTP